MKKNFKKTLIIIFLFVPVLISGCSSNINLIIQERLSEVRFNQFVAYNEKVYVKFTSGFREDPYVLNGISENKKEFGVITVKFLTEIENKNIEPSFVITINGMDFDGTFELNPFDQTYVQDIETYVLNDSICSIKIMWNEFNFESILNNISNSFNCNHTKSLSIFISEYKKEIKNLIKSDINFEVYVKIIDDPSINLDKFYFYVCLISSSGESFSLIIDPYSCEVLAKNESKNQLIL